MKNKLHSIRATWTYNHKLLIITLALTAAHLLPLIPIPTLEAQTIVATNPPLVDNSLEAKVEERAEQLYKDNQAFDLEKYRQEAIRELGDKLMSMSATSPYVDYDALRVQHGH